MALFYIFGCIDTGSCSQTQRPLTHQSKKLLCSAAPHHAKVLSLLLSLHLLCALSPTSSFSELILLNTTQSSLGSLPPSVQSLSDSPNLPLYSHSPPLSLYPPATLSPLASPPTFSITTNILFSLVPNRAAVSRIAFKCHTPN